MKRGHSFQNGHKQDVLEQRVRQIEDPDLGIHIPRPFKLQNMKKILMNAIEKNGGVGNIKIPKNLT